MKHKLVAGALLVAATAAILGDGWVDASAPSPDPRRLRALVGLCIAIALLLVMIAFARRRRWPAIANYLRLFAVSVLLAAVAPIAYSEYRFSFTQRQLTERYNQLAAKGPPFPASAKKALARLSGKKLVSHGYWVSPDRQSFELFYHLGSDSRTLPYPTGKWQWRGFDYQGPKVERKDAM